MKGSIVTQVKNTTQEQLIPVLYNCMITPGIHELILSHADYSIVSCLVDLNTYCMRIYTIYQATGTVSDEYCDEYLEEYLLTQLYCTSVMCDNIQGLPTAWLRCFKRTVCNLNLTQQLSVMYIDYY